MAEKEAKEMLKAKLEKSKSTSDLLVENFVSLQRIMADLAVRISHLNNQLSRLLSLFEDAAKSFKEGEKSEFGGGAANMGELASKIDRLIEQNKAISRGLSLVSHAAITKEVNEAEEDEIEEETEKVKAKPLPEFKF